MILSTFFIVASDVIVKLQADFLPASEILFFRSLFGIILLLLSFIYFPIKQKGGKFGLLLLGGFFSFLGPSIFYYLIANIDLASASVLFKSSVLFGTLFSFIFLKERLSYLQILALFIGFTGVLLVLQPQVSFSRFEILGLICGSSTGVTYQVIKIIKNHYSSRTIVLTSLLFNCVILGIGMIVAHFIETKALDFMINKFVMPDLNSFLLLFSIALLALIANILKTKAFIYAKTGIIGSISYLRIALSCFLGILLGDNLPDTLMIIGIILIIISGIMVSLNKTKDLI
ncbi:MAG: Conserved hypothetical membrane protein (DUF6) [uncultured Campylobacterales bacterium]|uniref:Conserved hypothetical membrane protein (DUF6) n=1 Tax=uncultured Campylobacterales bacterium TaxID=352960 RepID=A0A6S6S8A0_9BACT|nr:MAG: Conserved hypothetical membrane protein (DUF6) [uncultured Campylobacterales bacterium]